MSENAKENLAALLLEYPRPLGIALGYGTAGFRNRADILPWIMIRIGLLASLRSKVKKGLYLFLSFLFFSNENFDSSLYRCDDYCFT